MPALIQHIDAIAREKQRDVLFITVNPANMSPPHEEAIAFYNWEQDPIRASVCTWLTEQGITWQNCAHIADVDYMGSYEGQIYLDVPFDENDHQYQLVRDYLENPDGTMRFETVGFWCLPLEKAMENAHHDELGFWERWAESF